MIKRFAILIMLALALALPVFPASSVTQTSRAFDDVVIVNLAWTAHTDGTFTSTALSSVGLPRELSGYYFVQMDTDPGTTAPQDNYDITLTNDIGVDVLGGAGANRDTLNSEVAQPILSLVITRIMVDGALTLGISGNNVNAATGTIRLYFVKASK